MWLVRQQTSKKHLQPTFQFIRSLLASLLTQKKKNKHQNYWLSILYQTQCLSKILCKCLIPPLVDSVSNEPKSSNSRSPRFFEEHGKEIWRFLLPTWHVTTISQISHIRKSTQPLKNLFVSFLTTIIYWILTSSKWALFLMISNTLCLYIVIT